MTWSNEQAQRRKSLAQPQKNCSEDFLFTAMRTAAKEHGALWIQMIQRQGMGGLLNFRYLVKTGRIVLDAACRTNSIARNSKRCPAVGIFLFWYANQVQKPEGWRDKKSELPVPSLRVWGQPRVD